MISIHDRQPFSLLIVFLYFLYTVAGAANPAPIVLNRAEGPLSYTLLNTSSAIHQPHHPPAATSSANHSQSPNIQQIYQQETSSHSDKLSLLLAEGNMMSHSGDGVGSYYISIAMITTAK